MKENYTAPQVKRIGFLAAQEVAAFEFDDLLIQAAGKQDPTEVSQGDIPVIIEE